MGCTAFNCWRYSVLFYIIVFFTTGIGHLVSISYILLRRFSLRFFVADLRVSLYWSYSAPILLFATTAVGWNGVYRRRRNILRIFSSLMSFIVSLEIIFSVWSFMEKEDIDRSATDVLTSTFPTLHNTSLEWDSLQTKLKCCGVHEHSEYAGKFPKSCTDRGMAVFTRGCLYPLVEILSEDFLTASLVMLVIAMVQIPGVFLSWCLSNRIVEIEINSLGKNKETYALGGV